MELLEYWKIIYKRLWLIILLMVLAGSSAVYYTSQRVDRYSTSTTLFINPGRVSPLVPGQTTSFTGESPVETLVNTYQELMRTRSFVERVEEEMDDEDISSGTISEALTTHYVPNTQFFRISATHTDPEIAQEIANTAAEVLIAREMDRQEAQQRQRETQQNSQANAEFIRIEQLITSIEAELDYYDNEIQQNEQAVLDLQDEPESPTRERQLEELFEELAGNRYTRLDVLRQLADAQERRSAIVGTTTSPLDTAVVVDEALVPTAPLPRNDVLRVLMAIGVGMMIGVGLAFLLEYLDYTIKTPESLETVYGLPVQGVISVTPRKYFRNNKSPLISLMDNRSPTAESFRALRTGVQVSNLSTPLRSILVTSAGPGEGKTFIAANLAASLAHSGKQVILVDTDLRKPRLHQVFELSRDIGFTNLVVNRQHNLIDGLHKTSTKNLRVMTCGVVPPNPSELLSSQRADELMKQLGNQADIVIYDSPPAATVTDATILAQRVDAVIQVVWAGHTRINHILRCKSVLEHVGATILGTVLNQVKTSDLGYSSFYYYYGYYQENGHAANGSLWRKILPGGKKKPRSRSVEMVESINGTNGTSVIDDENTETESTQRSEQ
jgi:non-specific protein-tyrosine kinase